MCGIIGIFNHPEASHYLKQCLPLLQERGQDGVGIATSSTIHHAAKPHLLPFPTTTLHLLGHALHAVVDTLPQPLRGKGILSANCEIYNWKELNSRYNFGAQNDADLLLQLLDKMQLEALPLLDGVYAFAYWRGDSLLLARDLLGEKPLWYVHTTDFFAFASEKKILTQLGTHDIQELNPRHVLIYDIPANTIATQYRPFFTHLPEHTSSHDTIKKKTEELLGKAIDKRIPEHQFGVLFSGGVDSTYIAKYLQKQGYKFTCYTAALDTDDPPAPDLIAAQHAAQELGLHLKVKKIMLSQLPAILRKVVPLIEDSNVVKVGVALPLYVACEMARKDGCKVIFSGLGSEEIFAGYERHKHAANINQECVSGLLKMYERDLYRDDVVTMHNGVELRLPFLDTKLVSYALKIPEKYKIRGEFGKFIFREIAQDSGMPAMFAFRKKTAAQYGSRFDHALSKLAKQGKYPSKSAFLRPFYPSANLRVGVLFSGGKDSTYAAYIMHRQNYQLACLITIRSHNPDSFMFHTPGVELTTLQAEAMEIPQLIYETEGEKEVELKDLEEALSNAKRQFHIDGIVTGAIFSTYQRDRIEHVCDKVGLKIFSPLWHKPQSEEMRELLDWGFRFIFTSIAAEGLDKSWLNTIVTEHELRKLEHLHQKYGLNVAGEGGETESLVLDCPLFHQKIEIQEAQVERTSSHAARLIIREARLRPKEVTGGERTS